MNRYTFEHTDSRDGTVTNPGGKSRAAGGVFLGSVSFDTTRRAEAAHSFVHERFSPTLRPEPRRGPLRRDPPSFSRAAVSRPGALAAAQNFNSSQKLRTAY